MRVADTITNGTLTYSIYWQTAMDGKRYCRVKVYDSQRGTTYQYGYYFKTKKAARLHISAGC